MSASGFPYGLAAIDLDDTLLGPDKRLSAANAAAVERLKATGVRVVIASGRWHENGLRFHRQLGLSGWLISSAGGVVRHAETGETIVHRTLPVDVARRATEEGTRRGVAVLQYRDEAVYVTRDDAWNREYKRLIGNETTAAPDLATRFTEPPLKALWLGEPARLAAWVDGVRPGYAADATVMTTLPFLLEFTPLGISKATALAAVAARCGVPRERVLAFGDGNNDEEMLRWAGCGVAMAHAADKAKAAAKLVAPPGDPETSLARAVEMLSAT
jgi:Cof subfamily protein (haloacid dehalogenase superfamily)